VVINARDEMDKAAELYRRLGFQLTPRGYHTLGSMNHLAMFGTDYLELIAIPKGATTGRVDLLNYPHGLNGFVFGTEDSAATYAALTAAGVTIEPPQQFSRPVEIDGQKRDAVFRTVRFKAEVIPAGRVYFCHHFTRDLVWRDEWRHHANGSVAVVRGVFADEDPAGAAAIYRKMFGADAMRTIEGGESLAIGASRLDIVTPAELKRQFGGACPDAAGRKSYMAALSIRTTGLRKAARALKAGEIAGVVAEKGRIVVPAAQALNATLEFVE
jgi:hypothetical protein